MRSTLSLDAGIGELHAVPKHPLSGTDPESYFDIHIVPSAYQPKKRGRQWVPGEV